MASSLGGTSLRLLQPGSDIVTSYDGTTVSAPSAAPFGGAAVTVAGNNALVFAAPQGRVYISNNTSAAIQYFPDVELDQGGIIIPANTSLLVPLPCTTANIYTATAGTPINQKGAAGLAVAGLA